MEITDLDVFINVARAGSFAAVARRLEVDPSAISRTISGLEEELGVRLFQRTTRKMNLTDAGKIYLNRVTAVVDELERAHEEVLAEGKEPKGVLRLSASVAEISASQSSGRDRVFTSAFGGCSGLSFCFHAPGGYLANAFQVEIDQRGEVKQVF
jgi:DNA-binding MarR family transcriptional regulator